jgi:KUP system potassium uptake protein
MQAHAASAPHSRSRARTLFLLVIGSIGVVYGDIGTSPLYAFREALRSRRVTVASARPRSSACSR